MMARYQDSDSNDTITNDSRVIAKALESSKKPAETLANLITDSTEK